MTTVYVGQIETFAFNFAPRGWAQCNGQLLAIAQNQALFSLLGVMYGGDGRTTFALPDLRGRVPLGYSSSYPQGAMAGQENVTLITAEMPMHNHVLRADATSPAASNSGIPTSSSVLGSSTGTITNPSGNFALQIYTSAVPNATLGAGVVGLAGGNQPHENRMPFLVLNICIALQGIFPTRN